MAAKRSHKKERRSTRRDPERTRAAILRAATALFTRCGLNGTSLDDISREAGVNRGLIYHYFKTKESLFDQVLAQPLNEYTRSQLELLQKPDFDALSLRDATESFFWFLSRHPELVRLLSWTLAMRRLALELAQLEFTRLFFRAAVQRLDQAKAAGRIRANIDSAHLLITIIDLCVSWHMSRDEWAHKFGWTDKSTEELDRERLAAILDFIDAAVRPLPPAVTETGD
ncbi:MAG: TetR/AcrR family transcriptional regulator [Deltaproteobacteria bacterium]|nr:MAG: TetR/AcrR family transcriptional regulator [Deltaproteobacteria bacterium]